MYQKENYCYPLNERGSDYYSNGGDVVRLPSIASAMFDVSLFLCLETFFPSLPALGNATDSLGISAGGCGMKIKFKSISFSKFKRLGGGKDQILE